MGKDERREEQQGMAVVVVVAVDTRLTNSAQTLAQTQSSGQQEMTIPAKLRNSTNSINSTNST